MAGIRAMLAANEPWNEMKIAKHLREAESLTMQPKWDGMRCLMDPSGKAMSRSWKPLGNLALQKAAQDLAPTILSYMDGEVFGGHEYDPTTFRKSMSSVRSAEGSRELTLVLYDYYNPHARLSYSERRLRIIDQVFNGHNMAPGESRTISAGDNYALRLMLTEQREVRTLEEIYAYEIELLTNGHEGGILRRRSKPYKYGRATLTGGELIKLKRFVDAEAVVVGYEPWYENQNEATVDARGFQVRSAHQANLVPLPRLGALICHLLDQEGKKVIVNGEPVDFKIGVFRGLTHGDREGLWEIRQELVGRVAKFEHQGYGGGYDKPRTPIWVDWRESADLLC